MLSEAIATNQLISWLKRKTNVLQRCLLYCENRYEQIKNVSIEKARKLGFEIWSYSLEDCMKHHFYYVNQFNDRDTITNYCKNPKIKYDTVFVGLVKDRGEIITKTKESLDRIKNNSWFYVIGLNELAGNLCKDNRFINYGDYIHIVCESRCVIDLVSDTNKGLTFRPIEALFLKKKLITNIKNKGWPS